MREPVKGERMSTVTEEEGQRKSEKCSKPNYCLFWLVILVTNAKYRLGGTDLLLISNEMKIIFR